MVPERYQKILQRYQDLERQLSDPTVMEDKSRYQKLAKEFSALGPTIEAVKKYQDNERQIVDLEHLLKEKHDREFEQLAKSEMRDLQKKEVEIKEQIEQLLLPKDADEDRDVIVEIRAGTGGQEASLFAADLYRMYNRYAEKSGWKSEVMSHHESETGGFKEVILSISGKGAARHLKWESGVHRVQRVPTTEASGRIHTSAATVAVLPEPEEIEVNIDPKDLKVDVYRSSGPGGQSVNTTDSAIRITHLPTGIVVVCQDERSQLKNKLKAMRVMRARLHDKMKQEAQEKTVKNRKAQIGTGDRSEKIRTYNFSDRRVTDHRIGFSLYTLPNVMDGELDELTGALIKAEQEIILQNQLS
jgi:peptide chain release factor 1